MKSIRHSKGNPSRASLALAPAFAMMSAFGAPAMADTFDWIQGNGTWDWEDSANWVRTSGSGTHLWPCLPGDVAILTNDTCAVRMYVSLDSAVSVGTFIYRNAFTLSPRSAGGRLVLDNLGETAVLEPFNNPAEASNDMVFNAPVEIAGTARVGKNSSGASYKFPGGFIGGADSRVVFKCAPGIKEPQAWCAIELGNNDGFHGVFESWHICGSWWGVIVGDASGFGSAREFVNAGMLCINFAISDELFSRIVSLPGAQICLDGNGTLANVVDPSPRLPPRGSLDLRGNVSDRWPDGAVMRLASTRLGITGVAEPGAFPFEFAGDAILGNRWDNGDFQNATFASIRALRGGTLTLGIERVPDNAVLLGEAGATLGEIDPDGMRQTLGNGVTLLSPRVTFPCYPAKITGAQAPHGIARFDEADFTHLENNPGPNDIAYLTTNQSISANATWLGFHIRDRLNLGDPFKPTLTLRGGYLGTAAAATQDTDLNADVIFGESLNQLADGVLVNSVEGGRTWYFRETKFHAKDLYMLNTGNGGARLLEGTTFCLEGELFIRSQGVNWSLENSLGLDHTVVNIESQSGGGGALIYNGRIGGVRGGSGVLSISYNFLVISNAVDCAFGGTIRNDHNFGGAFPLIKRGPGEQAFTGAVTVNGEIRVEEGTLRIDCDASNASLVTVGAAGLFPGGTLAGTGVVGETLLTAGGVIAPGKVGETGALTFAGNLTATGGALEIDLASPAAFDQILVNGDADIGAAQIIVNLPGGYTPASTTVFPIVTAAGTLNTAGLPRVKGFRLWQEGGTLFLAAQPSGTLLLVK